MRDFSKVSVSLWQSDRFTNLPTDDARMLFLYMLTTPHGNSAGCFRLADGYAQADLRWTAERYCAARLALVDSGMIEYDAATSVVLIAKWFDHNPIMNMKHRQGVEAILRKIPCQHLRDRRAEEIQALAEKAQAEREEANPLPNNRLNTAHLNGKGRRPLNEQSPF
jgi:hypothetical protein